MADNVELNAGTGGAVVKTDDDGTAHWQYVKVAFGADNTQTRVTSSVGLPVSDAGGSLTVDNGGTFAVQAAQSGTWNVNNVSGTISLPTGAATAAKQPALGTAGSASTDVISVQGIASMTALTVDGSGVTQPVSGTVTVQDGGGALTVDNGGTFAVQAAQSGTWNITNVSGTVSLPTGASTAAKQPALGTAGTASSDVITVQGISSMTALVVDGSGVTQPVSGTVTANLGATDNAVLDTIVTQTQPAQSMYRNIDANAEDAIKGSAGVLHWLHVINLTAAKAYVHLYNATAANVTPGTTTPDLTFPVPTQGDTNGAGFNLPLGPNGQNFSTAITLVCTTTTDGSTGDPGTNGVMVMAGYT